MDRDISSELTGRMPIVPHGTAAGVDCCGCIVAVVEGDNVELRCNECGAVVGVVQLDILKGLIGLDQAKNSCGPSVVVLEKTAEAFMTADRWPSLPCRHFATWE
jgi:hypothetical protein